jgi:alkylation response protein AidB-like acyl-CoA dehydrogenase
VITTQEALSQARSLVSAVEHALDQALIQARSQTQGGQGIDDHQVHCERLAYRATEVQAVQALLHYAEMQGQHGQDDGVTGHMALAYAAEVHQAFLAEVGAHLMI